MLTSKPPPLPWVASIHTRTFLSTPLLASTFEGGNNICDIDLSNNLLLLIPMSSISTSPALDFVRQRCCIFKITDLKMLLLCFSVFPLRLHLDWNHSAGPLCSQGTTTLYQPRHLAWFFNKIKFIILYYKYSMYFIGNLEHAISSKKKEKVIQISLPKDNHC